MTYFVNVIDEQGNFELIDGDFAALYEQLNFEAMPQLSEAQYQAYLTKANGREKFRNGEFVFETITVDEQAVFLAEKSAKLAEINQQAQAFVNRLAKLDETPEFERETWTIQRDEAKAWQADHNAETPTLAMIAQMRGIPLDSLRKKAYKKAVAYQQLSAAVAGQRQAYEDKLHAAETLEQLRAITVQYSVPNGQGSKNENLSLP